jgi:hypothetical protein
MFGSFHVHLLYNAFDVNECQGAIEAAEKVRAHYFLTPFPAGRQIEAMEQFAKEIMPSYSEE